ncbi:Lem3/Cdc50 [Hyaloscypha variabilis F]|uniref:Lem3/Cdc50 n=1 Tax=Hyaloscypha variabilis (strain UAMH 11265 / GT02V1 / F) TaxID=1149755 RepID=A0A2J6S202_HYAVF|nr:Lem3/Cdc50 [Hyaloscypha variabilis F]
MADQAPGMTHEDSIGSQDPHNLVEEKKKSRRPANTAFRQQRLKAWQPILTPKTVLPLFFAIGIIFAPIGGGLLYASAQVQELIIDYSTCFTDAPESPASPTSMPSNLVTSHFNHPDTALEQAPEWSRQTVNVSYGPADPTVGSGPVLTTRCTILFSIPADMTPPVLFYYRLTNFYQNHRRYAKSFNTDQLSGTAVSAKDVHNSDCTPLTTVTEGKNQIAYYPCGLAPNSVFNDTFYSPILLDVANSNNKNETYVMQNTSNISWESDKKLYGESKYNWSDVAVPPNWIVRYPNGYSDAYHPDLVNDEQFQVWMRLAGLPTFSKLTQRNDTTTMSKGRYSIDIDHHFNVTEYGGTKSIIISTRTVMGGKNPFLGIAYVVVGGLCIVLGALFTVTHLIKPRKLGDHTYLSWNNEAPSAAVHASGRDLGGEGHA